jgi:asparagine synthase (glutamine-hydrolysing)
MCGISGKVNFQEKINPEDLLDSISIIKSRGPDKENIIIDGPCGLAHARLAILDLSKTGDQPMVSSNGQFICVFNGEIYNFQKIRKKLENKKVTFKGSSDTEVLLESWNVWGSKTLDYLDGMFAFAIWDKFNKKLFIARDRIGEKPLYYSLEKNAINFASRPACLFKLDKKIKKNFSTQGIRYFLESGYFPSEFSVNENIKKLKAGQLLEFDEKGLKTQSYWNSNTIKTNYKLKEKDEEKILDELDSLLYESVKERMISDVPIGAFLSGGIDSSIVVAMMSKISSRPIKTFTIGFREKDYDESSYAEQVANFLNTEHTCKILEVSDLLSLLPDFLQNFDEPFFDSSAFPSMAVSQLAREKVKVCLTGDGGDELFGGYHYYKIVYFLNIFFKLPKNLRIYLAKVINFLPNHSFKLLAAALKKSSIDESFAFSRSIAKDFHSILNKDVIKSTLSLESLFKLESKNFPKNLHAVERSMRLDSKFTLCDDYLQKTDLSSMTYSLETRTPFLEKSLIEWSMELPHQLKVNASKSKYLLKKLLYRYVPKSLVDRPKQGFGVPIDSWLRNELKDWANEKITNKDNYKNLPLNQEALTKLFHLHLSGKRDAHPLIWASLMLLEFNRNLNSEK